jgi:hypothetical protein
MPRLGVVDGEVQDRVDAHHQVVLGDDRLRWEGHHLLAQVDERLEAVDERHEHGQPRVERAAVAAKPLDDARARLRDDPHCPGEHDHQEDDDDDGDDGSDHDPSYSLTSAVAPLMSTTSTRAPGSISWSS